ncbi:SDR family NAD(P)-dependent oxidoreductase [Actinomadura livida]|uniref:3-oxoacyl-[acyl-carrier protein] reductase n=1 Tax=Actinomadura livida TaxID=79909 RepID=A0A7W7IFC0_9ACTN|nr:MULTISPECIES: SDR family NAD(P)-dependent oxidoreductase [Actinomadura]MBB4775934.1 3-oxoacyl-[acyl-carrier protein] reductase [Actinomadura catellatispora]GGU16657.1 3-oxoacyl-ACP reductase [Actinomadura livida]
MTEPNAPERYCAVVTGGARGIGEGIVDELLGRGTPVVVADLSEPDLEAFTASHAASKDLFRTVKADISREEDWLRVRDAARASFGPACVLVNNAAISPKKDGVKCPALDTPLDEWERVLAVNLTGAFIGCKTLLPDMVAESWGRIVNISSQSARTGAHVAGIPYGTAKTGLLGLTRTLAIEYGRHGVTANAITPGRVVTPMAEVAPDHVNRRLLDSVAVGRYGTPHEIGAVVAFLASEAASYVTGATIDVNGGSYMG